MQASQPTRGKKTAPVPQSQGQKGSMGKHVHDEHLRAKEAAEEKGDKKSDIWNVAESEERRRIKEFWLSLSEKDRNSLIKLEKEAVLKKMKGILGNEQQKYTCSCSVCGRRRVAIEEELEMLYDAYYEELERYAEREDALSIVTNGGLLSVADGVMINEGKKFLEMMEKLAERRMRRQLEEENEDSSGDAEYSQDEDDEEEEEDDGMTEEQRLEEGKRMFQMFAAKMFEQRILTAYREKVALEKQKQLIEEEEEKKRNQNNKKRNKREKQKTKQVTEEERLKKLKQEEEAEQRKKIQEEEKKKRDEEMARKKEEDRKKREEEKLAKQQALELQKQQQLELQKQKLLDQQKQQEAQKELAKQKGKQEESATKESPRALPAKKKEVVEEKKEPSFVYELEDDPIVAMLTKK
jgi:hypothetical protein